MTPLTDKLLAVPVRDDANKECIINNKLIVYRGDLPIYDTYDLPTGNYSILGLCTPEEIGFDPAPYLICSGEHEGSLWYMDYRTRDEGQLWFATATLSFRSLLQSKSLDASKHYLII